MKDVQRSITGTEVVVSGIAEGPKVRVRLVATAEPTNSVPLLDPDEIARVLERLLDGPAAGIEEGALVRGATIGRSGREIEARTIMRDYMKHLLDAVQVLQSDPNIDRFAAIDEMMRQAPRVDPGMMPEGFGIHARLVADVFRRAAHRFSLKDPTFAAILQSVEAAIIQIVDLLEAPMMPGQDAKPNILVHEISVVNAPPCTHCDQPMEGVDDVQWVCRTAGCPGEGKAIEVAGVYPIRLDVGMKPGGTP